jgi:hypothetical protein
MLHAHIVDRSELKQSFGLNLVLAMAFAAAAAYAYEFAKMPNVAHANAWQIASIIGQMVTLLLTREALRSWKQLRALPEEIPEQRAPSARARGEAAPREGRLRPRALLDFLYAKIEAAAAAFNRMAESEGGETMQTTAKPKEPAFSRIDAERERLRKAGFTDEEIRQILIARETGAAQGMSGGGHGVLSGVLSNLAAVMTHARNFLPSLVVDLARMLNRRVPPIQRMEAALTLVAKCVVIGMLAYIVSIEFAQLKALSDKARAEACIERQKNAVNFSTMNELMSGSADRDLNKDCKNL